MHIDVQARGVEVNGGCRSRPRGSVLALKLSAGFAVAVFALTGCATNASVGSSASEEAAGDSSPQDEGEAVPLDREELLGSWSSEEKGKPSLDFQAGGLVTGTDGCNGIRTQYTVTEESAVLDRFVSTLKACVGVDDWLRGVREVEVEGDVLIVKDAEGEEIGQLQRD